MENLGKFITGLFLITTSIMINGYIFMTLWGWFIVSYFNVCNINIFQSMGFVLITKYLLFKRAEVKKDEKNTLEKMAFGIFMQIGIGLVTLLIGWLISKFI